jgi:hypothetical protein
MFWACCKARCFFEKLFLWKLKFDQKRPNPKKILALTNASKSHAKGWYFEILISWSCSRGFQVEYFDK